jgi:hypothetical protein
VEFPALPYAVIKIFEGDIFPCKCADKIISEILPSGLCLKIQ